MADELLHSLDLWLILLVSIAFLLAATETGFRLGRWAQPKVGEDAKSEISTIQAAMLGLLALILGFTFAMSMSRYETRKQLVLDEANAIGTTFLRAQLLPEPPRKEISNLLRQYVEVRLALAQADLGSEEMQTASDQTDLVHRQLWVRAATLGEREPRSLPIGLFLQSLNEMIDLHAKRVTALENRVPGIIFFLLYFVAIMTTALIGYGCGLGGRRNFVVTLVASVLIAAVILVIVDLDRPRKGLIRVSQQRIMDLRHNLVDY